jgi:hypothetical protein
MARKAWAQGMFALLAAWGGRSAVRGGRLAAAALLALRGLHANWKIFTLSNHDAYFVALILRVT